MKLKIGSIYVVAGRGEMLLNTLPNQWGNVLLTQHNGYTYCAAQEDLIREANQEDLNARYAQAKPRGLDCKNNTCWCRAGGSIPSTPKDIPPSGNLVCPKCEKPHAVSQQLKDHDIPENFKCEACSTLLLPYVVEPAIEEEIFLTVTEEDKEWAKETIKKLDW